MCALSSCIDFILEANRILIRQLPHKRSSQDPVLWFNLHAFVRNEDTFIRKVDLKYVRFFFECDVQRLLKNQLNFDHTCTLIGNLPVCGHVLWILCLSWKNLNCEDRLPYTWFKFILQRLQIYLWWELLKLSCEYYDNLSCLSSLCNVWNRVRLCILIIIYSCSEKLSHFLSITCI